MSCDITDVIIIIIIIEEFKCAKVSLELSLTDLAVEPEHLSGGKHLQPNDGEWSLRRCTGRRTVGVRGTGSQTGHERAGQHRREDDSLVVVEEE